MWISEDREPDLGIEYEAIMRSLYPEDFVDSVMANDETAAIFLGGPIKHERHGDLIIKYVDGPDKVGIMGLLSKTHRLKASDAGALRSWLKRLRDALDSGKEVFVSLNKMSEPLFMRALEGGNFKVSNLHSHDYPFGTWKTVRVSLAEAYMPQKYLKGVKNKAERKKEIERNAKAHQGGQSRFDDASWKTDFKKSGERQETKPSKYTSKFKEKFGEMSESLEKSIKNKAEKCGVPLGIARQVVKRGQAAWASGHRPGTTPEQWGLARLNSFCTGGKTTKTADKDLYSKWKSKK